MRFECDGGRRRYGPGKSRGALLLIGLLLATGHPTVAQHPRVVIGPPSETPAGGYRLTLPDVPPRALLVLIGSWGDTHDTSIWRRLGLDTIVASVGVATLEVNNTPWQQNYFRESALAPLDSIVGAVMDRYQLPAGRVIMGGFELGGGAALKYAIRCERTRCGAGTKPLGVFAINPILDYTRFWTSYTVYLQRPRGIAKDRKAILASMERELGGSPANARETYRFESIYESDAVDGGAARHLLSTPVRLYMDPDITWALESTQDDYFSSNLMDIAGLHLFLARSGHPHSQVVVYSARAALSATPRRPDLVVNGPELRQWIDGLLAARQE